MWFMYVYFIRNCQTFFENGYTIFENGYTLIPTPESLPTLRSISFVFILSHSNKCVAIPCSFNLHFPDDKYTFQHSCMYLFGTYVSFFGEVSVQIFCLV